MSDRTPAGDKGTADRIEADDGGYWVRLMTRQALDREGACMDHCVGEGGYDKLVGGEDLVDDAIWSLRDRDGMSVLTVRIWLGELDSAKGFSNHEPGRGASMQVRHLVAAFKAAGHALGICRDTGIVLLEDGRTFRHDRLPPEVQAGREEAQRQREAARSNVRVRREQVTFRLSGEAAPTPFRGDGRIDIRSSEGPHRHMVDSREASPFSLTAGMPDPVVRVWSTFDTGCHTCVTRSGIRFTVPVTGIGSAWTMEQAHLSAQRYRAAVAPTPAPPPSGDQPGEVPAMPSAGPGGPGSLVVEFFGGGMSGAYPGGGGGRGSAADYEQSIRHSLEHAVLLNLQAQIVGPGAPDPADTTFRVIPLSEAIEAAPHLPPADTYLPMFEEGPANGGGGERIEILGETNILPQPRGRYGYGGRGGSVR